MIEVRYLDVPTGVGDKFELYGDHLLGISDTELLRKTETATLYATQELGGWPLNGSRKLVDAHTKEPFWSEEISGSRSGYVGAGILGLCQLADEVSAFRYPSVLWVMFPQLCAVSGVTFEFPLQEDNWCSRVHVRLYANDELVWEEDAWPEGPRWELDCSVPAVNRVEFRFLETAKPGRYAKLSRIYIGKTVVFTKEELKTVELINECDPGLDELTVDTMTVEVRDLKERNLHPRKDQRIELYYGGKLLASHTIDNCSSTMAHHYRFTSRSLIGQLEDTFLGGMYDRVPLKTLLDSILQDIPYKVDEAFQRTVVTGYLPVCTRRQALQQVAFTVGAAVSTLGTDHIRLSPVQEIATGAFGNNQVFRGATVETNAGVSRIEVVAHQYTPAQDRQTLIDGEVLQGESVLLTFPEPHHSYEVTGGTLVEQGANYIVISAKGEVTVTAGVYRHTCLRYGQDCGTQTGMHRDQIRKVENVTLIHSHNVKEVLSRLSKLYAQQQQVLTQDVVVDGQYAGQRVAIEDPSGNLIHGHITQMTGLLTAGGHTASVTVVGLRQTPQIAMCYAGCAYAGGKEVGL